MGKGFYLCSAGCSDRMDKLQFLYSSRSCFKYTIEELENELNPDYQSEFSYYRERMTKEQMVERLNRYKKALTMTDQAICFYIDCSTIDCKDKKKTNPEYTNSQLVLIFYFPCTCFFKFLNTNSVFFEIKVFIYNHRPALLPEFNNIELTISNIWLSSFQTS